MREHGTGLVNSGRHVTKVRDCNVAVELHLRINGMRPQSVHVDCRAGDPCAVQNTDPVTMGIVVVIVVVVAASGANHVARRGRRLWGLHQRNQSTILGLVFRNLVKFPPAIVLHQSYRLSTACKGTYWTHEPCRRSTPG